MNWNDIGIYLGIKLPDLIAGMFGGVVKALAFNRDKPWETVFSGIIGALVANYMGESISAQLGWGRGAVCFAVGIAGMVVAQVIIDNFRKWAPGNGGNNASRS